MRGGRDPIGVIEAAYRLDVPVETWLDGLLESVERTLDQGLGCYVWSVDRSTAEVRPAIRSSQSSYVVEHFLRIAEVAPLFMQRAYDGEPFSSLSQTYGRRTVREHPLLAPLRSAGFSDGIAAMVLDPDTVRCVGFGAQLPRVGRVPRDLASRWSHVVAHLGLAVRARARTRAAAIDGADAILCPGGRVAHAEGEARSPSNLDALRTAARDIDRARGRLRTRDPDEAVAIWRGLVSGRWSLIDHHDSDGRRYLVARRNDPNVPGSPLDARDRSVVAYRAQGHPLKLIAYELGLSIATVSASLARARAVLGLRDEDFTRAFSARPSPGDPGAGAMEAAPVEAGGEPGLVARRPRAPEHSSKQGLPG